MISMSNYEFSLILVVLKCFNLTELECRLI